jgi:hypothetical protein
MPSVDQSEILRRAERRALTRRQLAQSTPHPRGIQLARRISGEIRRPYGTEGGELLDGIEGVAVGLALISGHR